MITWEQAGDPAFLSGQVPEEERFVQREDGIRHPSPLPARAFIGLVRAGEQLARGLDADLQAAHGFGLHAYEVLLHLAAFSQDRRARISQLAEQTPLSQSRVSRLVAELEARHLVQRQPCATDSRGVDVSLTDQGLERLLAAQETHHASLERRFLNQLRWDDLVQLARLANLLRDPAD